MTQHYSTEARPPRSGCAGAFLPFFFEGWPGQGASGSAGGKAGRGLEGRGSFSAACAEVERCFAGLPVWTRWRRDRRPPAGPGGAIVLAFLRSGGRKRLRRRRPSGGRRLRRTTAGGERFATPRHAPAGVAVNVIETSRPSAHFSFGSDRQTSFRRPVLGVSTDGARRSSRQADQRQDSEGAPIPAGGLATGAAAARTAGATPV